MRMMKYSPILLVSLLLSNVTYPMESILSVFCPCLKERTRRAKIQRDYENRGLLHKFVEGVGIMEYDHSAGEWKQTQGFKDVCAASERGGEHSEEIMRKQKERDEADRRRWAVERMQLSYGYPN